MAQVRTSQNCYFNNQYQVAGTVFEYRGPKQDFLELVSGQWEGTQKPTLSTEEALRMENEQLRQQLAAAAKPAPKAPLTKGKKLIKVEEPEPVEDAAFDLDEVAEEPVAEEPPAPKKGKGKKKQSTEPAAV